jgi:hypothetical protein
MAEFLIRNFDSTNPDPNADRAGCRKRGICDAVMPEGHSWGTAECLPKFVIIKCNLTDAELAAYEGMRKVWRDVLDYEVTATRPATGQYDVRIFETAAGVSSQNAITGAKATSIQGYLTRWGCTNIVVGTNQVTFTFVLWNAVRSVEFWDITASQFATISFTLNSYSSVTGVGNITVTVAEKIDPKEINQQAQMVTRKIEERGGTVTVSTYPNFTFTIERSAVLTNFRNDVKRKAETTFMYQQHRIRATVMDQIEAAGGVATLTKAQLVSAIRDMAAE